MRPCCISECPGSVHHVEQSSDKIGEEVEGYFLSVTLIPVVWPLRKPDVFAYSALENTENSRINL